MRTRPALSIIAILLLGNAAGGLAQQVNGRAYFRMFGDRVLGEPVRPAKSRFGGGILTGPAGEFVGRGRPGGGMAFSPSPWQYGGLTARPQVVPPLPAPSAPSPTGPPAGRVATRSATSAGSPVVAQRPSALHVDFAPGRPQYRADEHVAGLIARSPIRRRSPITVTIEGQTATLRGRVASQEDRMLAEDLALMEPGISQVRNELVVEGSPDGKRGHSTFPTEK